MLVKIFVGIILFSGLYEIECFPGSKLLHRTSIDPCFLRRSERHSEKYFRNIGNRQVCMQSREDGNSFKSHKLSREIPLDNLRQRSADGDTGHGYTAVMIVPTGIGASIGGYAGDALPAARVMASVVDTLITHPNVMNGASLYWPIPNALYTEGYALDMFAEGKWGLLPLHNGGHRIGLLLDKGMSQDLITRHIQAADAARATLVCLSSSPHASIF
jgi:hypothetical protein